MKVREIWRRHLRVALICVFVVGGWTGAGICSNVSEDTEACMECHVSVTPGIVADWERSRHAQWSPAEALKQAGLERRISNDKVPEKLQSVSVGCAECHTMNGADHKDTFEHNGYDVHVVVTPSDCATCHPVEVDEFNQNTMSYAYTNLVQNGLYRDLMHSINGVQSFDGTKISVHEPDRATEEESCLFCHGTAVEVKGSAARETAMGEMQFLVLSGWPNQGVGRLNPDGSHGSCAACHTRHQFAIEVARKPYACAQCHKGPDVPAYKVYEVSKHGNIYDSLGNGWDFKSVPWTVGKNFTAPTCAACHISLVTDVEGQVVVERSHGMNDRLPWRIFGTIYAHAHPKSPDLSVVRSRSGLPLPTELTGELASDFLIDADERRKRQMAMQSVCRSCHAAGWVNGHWDRFENTIKTSNAMTLAATRILMAAWDKGFAKGLTQKESIFDEAIERKWVEQWLFFANSTRFSSAMGGADYGVFERGRWDLARNIREMSDWLELHMKIRK